jgi:hypothetical protein
LSLASGYLTAFQWEDMNRRKFLTGAGSTAIVAVSGCISASTDVSGPNTNGSEDSSMSLSLTSVDNAPEPLSIKVTVSNDQLSMTEVPIVEIAAKNTDDETVSWSYGGGISDLPFPQGVHDSDNGGLVIGLEDEIRAQLIDASSGCARVDQFVRADGIQNTVLKAGEQTKRSYAIAGVAGELNGTCPDPGEYRMKHVSEDFGMWKFSSNLER